MKHPCSIMLLLKPCVMLIPLHLWWVPCHSTYTKYYITVIVVTQFTKGSAHILEVQISEILLYIPQNHRSFSVYTSPCHRTGHWYYCRYTSWSPTLSTLRSSSGRQSGADTVPYSSTTPLGLVRVTSELTSMKVCKGTLMLLWQY